MRIYFLNPWYIYNEKLKKKGIVYDKTYSFNV